MATTKFEMQELQTDEFFDEVYEGVTNSRVKQERFDQTVEQYLEENQDALFKLASHRREIQDQITSYQNESFNNKSKQYKINNEATLDLAKTGKLIKDNLQLNVDIFVDENCSKDKPQYFDGLIKDSLKKYQQKLKESSLYQSLQLKLNEQALNDRQNSYNDVVKLLSVICQMDAQQPDFLVQIRQLQQNISKLEQLDQIAPYFNLEIVQRLVEFLRQVVANFENFQENNNRAMQTVENYDSHPFYQSYYQNIQNYEPNQVKVQRYSQQLTNLDLRSLQNDQFINEKIVKFFGDFLRERNTQNQLLKQFKDTLIMKSSFFEELMPKGIKIQSINMRYERIQGETSQHFGTNGHIFERFKYIIFMIVISPEHIISVKISNSPNRLIEIFDLYESNPYDNLHERITNLIRAYIFEELKDKSGLTEQDSKLYAESYVGVSVNMPMVTHPKDLQLQFLFNYKLQADGNSVSQKLLVPSEVIKFRYMLFTLFMNIGMNTDKSLPFEIMI